MVSVGRNALRHDLEEGTDYKYIEHSVPAEVVEAANDLFITYQEEEQDLYFSDRDLDDVSEKYDLVRELMRTQHGQAVHGQIVLLGLSVLANHFDHYDSIKECYDSVRIEGSYGSLKPDIFDTDNRIILEAGFVTGFRESEKALLDKCISYERKRIGKEEKSLKYLNIPKSSFSNSAHDTGSRKVRKMDESSFSMYEIRFAEGFNSVLKTS